MIAACPAAELAFPIVSPKIVVCSAAEPTAVTRNAELPGPTQVAAAVALAGVMLPQLETIGRSDVLGAVTESDMLGAWVAATPSKKAWVGENDCPGRHRNVSVAACPAAMSGKFGGSGACRGQPVVDPAGVSGDPATNATETSLLDGAVMVAIRVLVASSGTPSVVLHSAVVQLPVTVVVVCDVVDPDAKPLGAIVTSLLTSIVLTMSYSPPARLMTSPSRACESAKAIVAQG